MHSPTIIERAFELARSATTVDEVRNGLRREGYSNVDAHLAGPSIRADLKKRFTQVAQQPVVADDQPEI
jgi:hypothetical protein